MEVLSVQLRVYAHPVLDESARKVLRDSGSFKTLPLNRANQVWSGSIPSQVCLMLQIQESAVFFTEDWEASIHGRRLIDCVDSLFAILNALGQVFGASVEIELLGGGDNALYRRLDRERNMRRAGTLAIWILTVLGSGLVGALIQWLFWGGS